MKPMLIYVEIGGAGLLRGGYRARAGDELRMFRYPVALRDRAEALEAAGLRE